MHPPVAMQDFSTHVSVLPQGCVMLPMGIVSATQGNASPGHMATPEHVVPEASPTVATPIKTVTDEWTDVHTIMMRNVPNKYTQNQLIDELNCRGFSGTFDFIYLPIDPDTDANRGYAFVNFDDPSDAQLFKAEFDGCRMSHFDSHKFLTVTPATLQGFDANYSHYANARVNRGDPAKRPMFFREPHMNTGKSRRSGRRHGKSMIDIALRSKDRKAAAAAKASMQNADATQLKTSVVAAQELPAARQFCPACGGKRSPAGNFCAFCGSSLA
jgi:hypothetical protein